MWKTVYQWIVRRHAKRAAIRHTLTEPVTIQSIGLLAEALTIGNARSRQAAENALTDLLPQLKASEAALLNGHQRFCLYRYLDIQSPRPDLTLAILAAMEQVGDTTTMPYVLRLAQADPCTRPQQRIVVAAQNSLPALRRRSAYVGARHTLLRAANVLSPSATIVRQLEEEA